jgi:hypothetical protein
MNKYYCDIYKSDEDIRTVNVNAKNIEKAAKKIFRTNKRYFQELGYVKVYSVNSDEKDTFNLSKWLTRDGKFISKPK